jgi:glucokinase
VNDLALAVDVGGTKVAVGVVDRSGELIERRQAPTPGPSAGEIPHPEAVWRALENVIGPVLAASGSLGSVVVCGVGCGGPMLPGGEAVSPLNIPAWRGFPLRARLQEYTGLPTFVDNDAKALALGEGWTGAAAGRHDYIGMVVSTGIGGGIVLNGRLLEGRLGNAGHIGHVVVEPEGRPCACGGRGCLEAEASGLALAAITGRPAAEASLEMKVHCGTLVGQAIASVANLLDLSFAVVAGSVALGFGEPFFAAAQAEIDARCRLDFARGTRVVPGGLGDRGPLIGAARVGWVGWEGRAADE